MQISLNYSETKIPLSFYANFIRFFFHLLYQHHSLSNLNQKKFTDYQSY